MQELLLKRNHLFLLHKLLRVPKDAQVRFLRVPSSNFGPKKRDPLRNFYRTFGLPLVNYLPDRTNHYRKCPTAIGEHCDTAIYLAVSSLDAQSL